MHNTWPLILLIVVIICFYFSFGVQHEAFTNISEPILDDPRKNHSPDRPYIWMYWENVPGKVRPDYLNLCYDTVKKNCEGKFNIVVLNNKNIYDYLPDVRKDLAEKLPNIPMKTDYYRYSLLYKYGGIWMDFDTIIVKDLTPLIDKLKQYDYVGFGCYYNDKRCLEQTGYPNPANWVMISRKGNVMFKKCLEACDNLLDTKPKSYFEKNYHAFGKNLLPMVIKHCQEDVPGWRYYHYPSKCLERDSHGEKLRNHVLISNREIDEVCRDSYYFVPIYNTSPGFPQWFKDLTKTGIIKSNTLIARLFKLALSV